MLPPHPRALAVALLLLLPAGAAAQDVIERARRANVPVPQDLVRRVQEQPGTFEFRRAWRQKVERVRENRAALEARQGPQLTTAQLAPAMAAVTGELAVPTLGGLYYDQPTPLYTAAQYAERLFGEAIEPAYSVRTFYREMSRGVFEVGGVVPAWPILPYDAAYYRPSALTDGTFGRTGEFLRDVLNALDGTIDFGQYDNDGPDGIPNSGDDDGYVDVAAFLYQDAAASCGGPGIWPHRWYYGGWWGAPYTTGDPAYNGGYVYVDDYMIQAGVECDGTSLMEIGTYAHELGHALALPDLYDTDGTSEGVGYWDLMGSGNWNTPASPAHMGAWSKDFLGWLTVSTLTPPLVAPQDGPSLVTNPGITLPEVQASGQVLRYDLPGGNEYFLLEHREAVGSDATLAGPGLLVWHIDQGVIDAGMSNNEVNANETRFGVDLEEADGLFHLDLGGFGRGDAGDPFPGSTLNTSFGRTTTPSSDTNDGLFSGLTLSSIALTGGTLTFDADIASGIVTEDDVVASAVPGTTFQTSIPVAMLDGSAVPVLASVTAPWLSVAPDSADTPYSLTLTFDATLLANGTYQDTLTLTSSALASSHRVPVTLNVPGNLIALGDTVVDSLTVATPVDTFAIDLVAGVEIDVVMYSPDGSLDTWVELYGPDGAQLAYDDDFRGTNSLIQGFRVPADGRYEIVARPYTIGSTGNYVLNVRNAGPVTADFVGGYFELSGPEGGLASDTLWLFNAGSGSLTFTATSSQPWITLTPSNGTLQASSPEEVAQVLAAIAAGGDDKGDPRLTTEGPLGEDLLVLRSHGYYEPPAGAVPIVVEGNLLTGALPAGEYYYVEAISVSSSEDPFGSPLLIDVETTVHSSAITTIVGGLPYWVGDVDRHPLGGLVVAAGGNVERVDPTNGARTIMAAGVSRSSWGLYGLAAAPDGSVYVVDQGDAAVKRVYPDGRVETVWVSPDGDPYDVTVVTALMPLSPPAGVAPSQTLYVTDYYSGLWRIGTDGTATHIPTGEGSSGYQAVFFNPYDGWVYYSFGASVYRYDPGSGTSELVVTTSGFPGDLELGGGGLVYVTESSGIGVYETFNKTLVNFHQAPDYGWGLTLYQDVQNVTWLAGTTEGIENDRFHRGVVFQLPVDDFPVETGGTYLVAEWPSILVPAGGSTTESLALTTQDGTAVSVGLAWDAPWLDVTVAPAASPPSDGPFLASPLLGTTPLDLQLAVDASLLAPGTYVDSITVTADGVANSPFYIPVTLHNGGALALGDSIFGSIDVDGETDTVGIRLPTSGSVDIAVFPTSGSQLDWLNLNVIDANGATVAWGAWRRLDEMRSGSLLAGWTPYGNGPHRLVVSGGGVGEYVLKARDAGAVVVAETSWMTFATPEGGASVTDTLYVFNTGPASVGWEGSSLVPWLTMTPTSGTLAAGSPEAVAAALESADRDRELRTAIHRQPSASAGDEEPRRPQLGVVSDPALAPPGAVAVVVTADPSALLKGHQHAPMALRFGIPSDGWAGDALVDAEIYVHEPTITFVARDLPYFTADLARHPDGDVIMLSGGNVLRVDPATGTRALVASGLSQWEDGLIGVAVAPDGSIFVVDQGDNAVVKIGPLGGVTPYWAPQTDFVYDVTVGPAGKLYAVGWYGGLWRIDGPGSAVNVAAGSGCCHYAVVFDPLDGRVYYNDANALRAYDPVSASVETVGRMHDWPHDLEVGASGSIYAHFWDGIRKYGIGSLVEQAHYASAGWGWGLAVMDGELWATTDGCCGNLFDEGALYRLPIADGPVVVGQRYLVVDALTSFSARPGQVLVDTLTLAASDASAIAYTASDTASWLTVAPAAGTTPSELVLTLDATGLAGGTYTADVVFSSAEAAADLVRTVTLHVAHVLAVGDSIQATIPLERDDQDQLITLAIGDVVDIAALAPPGSPTEPFVALFRPDGTTARLGTWRTAPDGAVVAAYAADVAGDHVIRVFGEPGSTYILKSRVAGDLIVGGPQGFSMWTPNTAAPVQDTVWLYNGGPTTVTWELVAPPPSWLTLSASTGALSPASVPAAMSADEPQPLSVSDPTLFPMSPELVTRRPPPAGAVPIVLTADPAGLVDGQALLAELEFRIAGELAPWAGNHPIEVELRAVDPTLTVVTPIPHRLMDVLVSSSTELLATSNRDLWKVDRTTGVPTVWVADLGADGGEYLSPLLGMELAPDGGVYVADQVARVIHHVAPDGTPSVAMDVGATTYDPIVLPGGALLAAAYPGFYKLEPDGSARLLVAEQGIKRATYNPLNGWIYYSLLGSSLKRVHPVTGAIEHLVDTGEEFINDLQIGAGGNLYAVLSDGVFVIADATLTPVFESAPLEPNGLGVALGLQGENVVYLTSQGDFGTNGHIYSRTVSDYRAPLPAAPPASAWVDDVSGFSGNTVEVGVYVDLTTTGKALGGFDAALRWDTAAASLVSIEQGGFTGSFESNTLGADTGYVAFAGLNTVDTVNVDTTQVALLTFQLTGSGGTSDILALTIESLDATDFTDLTSGLAVRNGVLTLASGHWGDPNLDGTITALDALMCLTVTVGRALPAEADPDACDVAPDLDLDLNGTRETFDGSVTSLDALAILSHVVLKALPAEFRVGALR